MKAENFDRLRRIQDTLRATGKPMAKYLADDIAEVLRDEGGDGLTSAEATMLARGDFVGAIKSVRNRKTTASGAMFGLVEAKAFVESAGERMGFYDPNPPAGKGHWHRVGANA